jgi:AcrR family transcriptional regulator
MKEEILHKSLQLFLKYGIREISNQKLVELLGISTKTVYKYFKNKEELLEEALNLLNTQSFKEWENQLVTYNTVALFCNIWYRAVEAEYNVNKVFYHDLLYYYPELHKKNEARLTKKFKEQFIQIIQKGIEEGYFQATINPDVVFETISILFKAIAREGRYQGFRLSSYEIMFHTIAVFIRGFYTQKGIQLLEEYIQTHNLSGKITAKERMVTNHT